MCRGAQAGGVTAGQELEHHSKVRSALWGEKDQKERWARPCEKAAPCKVQNGMDWDTTLTSRRLIDADQHNGLMQSLSGSRSRGCGEEAGASAECVAREAEASGHEAGSVGNPCSSALPLGTQGSKVRVRVRRSSTG